YWIYCSGHCDRTPSSLDVWDLESLDPFLEHERFVPVRAAPAAAGAKTLSGLQRLGMAAEVGVAVLSYREELAQEAARRAAPKASLCAQTASVALRERDPLVCPTCGATFTMRRTLQMHLRQHERPEPEPWVETGPLPSEDWRRDSYIDKAREEVDFFTARAQPEDLQNEEDWDSPEAAQYLVSNGRSSRYTLANLLDTAVPITSRRRKKAPAAQEVYGDCPICGRSFPQSELEEHVEQCLRTGPKEAPPVESATSAAGTSEFSQLPAELLESLLQLDLPPAAAEFFWCIYEHHVQSKSVQEAFLAALEEALAWVPETGGAAGSRDEGPELAACPVCAGQYPLETIQQHVEACLAALEAPPMASGPAEAERPRTPEPPKAPEREAPKKEGRGRWAKPKASPEPSESVAGETAQERIARLKAEAKQAKDAAKQRTDVGQKTAEKGLLRAVECRF
ncbi:unnamed protein product, partial [Symbiodinium sp. KB8]